MLRKMDLPNHLNCKILIIGLGYVGLPLALEFSKRKKSLDNNQKLNREVTGFDINESRIKELKSGFDVTNEVDPKELIGLIKSGSLKLTDYIDSYYNYDFFIVTVPTPIDKFKEPDLIPLIKASNSIGKILKKRTSEINPIIIFESTVYPGATEEICIPAIQKESGLIFNKDFYCGYSPERIILEIRLIG